MNQSTRRHSLSFPPASIRYIFTPAGKCVRCDDVACADPPDDRASETSSPRRRWSASGVPGGAGAGAAGGGAAQRAPRGAAAGRGGAARGGPGVPPRGARPPARPPGTTRRPWQYRPGRGPRATRGLQRQLEDNLDARAELSATVQSSLARHRAWGPESFRSSSPCFWPCF